MLHFSCQILGLKNLYSNYYYKPKKCVIVLQTIQCMCVLCYSLLHHLNIPHSSFLIKTFWRVKFSVVTFSHSGCKFSAFVNSTVITFWVSMRHTDQDLIHMTFLVNISNLELDSVLQEPKIFQDNTRKSFRIWFRIF